MLRGYYCALKSFTAEPSTDAIMKSTSPRQNAHLRNSRHDSRIVARAGKKEKGWEKKRKQRQRNRGLHPAPVASLRQIRITISLSLSLSIFVEKREIKKIIL